MSFKNFKIKNSKQLSGLIKSVAKLQRGLIVQDMPESINNSLILRLLFEKTI